MILTMILKTEIMGCEIQFHHTLLYDHLRQLCSLANCAYIFLRGDLNKEDHDFYRLSNIYLHHMLRHKTETDRIIEGIKKRSNHKIEVTSNPI